MTLPEWARRGRSHWRNTGARRPDFALPTAPGQESVWDYPRPPRVEPDAREVVVRLGGNVLARTRAAVRVLETASPPTFYIPRVDIDSACLVPVDGLSRCEWKGTARYFDVRSGDHVARRAAWAVPEPFPEFAAIRDHVAFYPAPLECFVDGERVRPQPGRFYAGWVTDEVIGPFKGEPGSESW